MKIIVMHKNISGSTLLSKTPSCAPTDSKGVDIITKS